MVWASRDSLTPSWPTRQQLAFSDGSIIPLLEATSPEQVDLAINEQYTGLHRSGISQIALYSSEVGQNAFSGCTSLSGVYVDKQVQAIGQDAFAGCPSL